jgi:hypothetical protein
VTPVDDFINGSMATATYSTIIFACSDTGGFQNGHPSKEISLQTIPDSACNNKKSVVFDNDSH